MSTTPTPLIPAGISATLVAGVRSRLQALANRFFPGFHLPGFLLGQRLTAIDPADLAYTLAWLWKLGVKDVGGLPVDEAIRRLLRRVDGPRTQIFYSYRVAEALLAFGPTFEGNPLLEGFDEAERENLRVATDTTAIYDPATGTMPGYPNNYWAVLARCEQRRQDLGLLTDTTILDLALARTAGLLFANLTGFFDDSPEGGGKFDIYTADVHLFCEPLWPTFDPNRLRANLQAHVTLLELGAQENGAAFAWGRSVGALSVCLTMELGAVALRLGLTSDPARMLGLVENARQRFLSDWLDPVDGLITSHRGRATEAYRGPYRQLQVTVDCLGKLLYTAKQLAEAPPMPAPTAPAPELFPAVDHYASFVPADAPRPAGLWAFRNEQLSFGLALTHGSNSDYAPSPRAPGLFENPVDSPLVCALLRVARGDRDFAPVGRPVLVEKLPGGLRVVHDGFPCTSDVNDAAQLPGRREVVYRVEEDALAVSEHWTFPEPPDALTWHLPEPAGRPLCLEVTGQPDGAHVSSANVNGLNFWRSAWGEAGRLHQVNFQPAREVRFAYRVRRQLRVALTTAEHDYTRLLYAPMPAGSVSLQGSVSGELPTDPKALAARLEGCDMIHLHWPEWSFAMPAGVTDEERERLLIQAAETLGQLPTRVVWTMHNRRPHHIMPAERGRNFYRAMAAVADGVIHHSRWGMGLMRGELPYKPAARHVVAAHGHFGSVNPTPRETRAELEARFGLAPGMTRFGVIGRPQKEKQVELIVRAFRAGAQPGQQLFVTAASPETVEAAGDDPRIVVRLHGGWVPREEIAAQIHVCDAIVNALTGDTYLTSGTSADAIGLGLAMLVPEWAFFRETLGAAAFYHDNTEAGLAALFARLTPEDIAHGRERMAALQGVTDWKTSAETTLGLLRSLPFRKVLMR